MFFPTPKVNRKDAAVNANTDIGKSTSNYECMTNSLQLLRTRLEQVKETSRERELCVPLGVESMMGVLASDKSLRPPSPLQMLCSQNLR